MSARIDKEKTRKTIALVLDKIRTEADPWLLDEYQRLFKKEISLFHRSKAAAYLLMLCEQEGNLRPSVSVGVQGKNLRWTERNPVRRTRDNRRFMEEDTADFGEGSSSRDASPSRESIHYPLAEEESLRLFFSVGRSRRVFPREILGLINSKTAISREDIGAIRILDNYSFVQVRDNVAEKIIEALNGMDFRGRPLTVNYARSRRDEENNTAENGDNSEKGDEHPQEENI
jgi:hypothetical protein